MKSSQELEGTPLSTCPALLLYIGLKNDMGFLQLRGQLVVGVRIDVTLTNHSQEPEGSLPTPRRHPYARRSARN